MTTAVLFGGQGTEYPGMGLRLSDACPEARELLDLASELTGHDVVDLSRRGHPVLSRTEVLQPTLTAITLGTWRWWRRTNPTPGVVLGHSLGELSAWAATGEIDEEQAVQLAAIRGARMAEAAQLRPGGMLCVQGTKPDVASLGLGPPGRNTPDTWVFSGPHQALRELRRRAGGVELPVQGPWHSMAMEAAARVWNEHARRLPLRARESGWIGGATGEAMPEDTAAALSQAMVAPVDWVRALRGALRAGARRFVVVGPGRPLTSWVRQTLGADHVHAQWLREPVLEEALR